MYLSLDAGKIRETIEQLRMRIEESFPGAGLANVAAELERAADKAATSAPAIARPSIPLRFSSAVLAVLVVVTLGWIAMHLKDLKISTQIDRLSEVFQAVDAALNTLLLLGGGIFFLFTLEVRLKRNRALKLLHELRSLAHIVDMHQLTKDPDTLLDKPPPSAPPPKRNMSRADLARYLDYCSDMAALIGKVAALYVQKYDDPVVLGAVDQIEDLTSSLARKAWQKIMVNQQLADE